MLNMKAIAVGSMPPVAEGLQSVPSEYEGYRCRVNAAEGRG